MEDRILYSPKVIKEILDQYGFKFTKSLGQNFLIDKNTLDGIVRESKLSKDDLVLEIGPGIGVLTKELSNKAAKVLSIELDRGLEEILSDNLRGKDNVKVHFGDILKVDLKSLVKENLTQGKIKVIANLPYYITTPILGLLFESDLDIESITVMVQKEVADRIVAKPSSKDYSTLSIFSQFYSNPKIALEVPKTVFMPQPNVDSAVVIFDMKEELADIDREKFFHIVKSSFTMRRKTLLNNLSRGLDLDKSVIKSYLEEIGIDPKIRAERLGIEEFLKITKKFYSEDEDYERDN